MTEAVLDASVALNWFRTDDEPDRAAALDILRRYQTGDLIVRVPLLLYQEVLNVAARRWRRTAEQLDSLARELERLRFGAEEPSLRGIARWAGRGLSAYDATYVALAEERHMKVITADRQILAVAGLLAISIAEAARE